MIFQSGEAEGGAGASVGNSVWCAVAVIFPQLRHSEKNSSHETLRRNTMQTSSPDTKNMRVMRPEAVKDGGAGGSTAAAGSYLHQGMYGKRIRSLGGDDRKLFRFS